MLDGAGEVILEDTGQVGLGLTLKEGQDRRGGPGQGSSSLLSEKSLGWELGAMTVWPWASCPPSLGLPCLLGVSWSL